MTELGDETRLGQWQIFRRRPEGEAQRVLLLPGGFCTAMTFVDLVADPALAGIETWAANPPGFGANVAPEGFGFATTDYAESIEKLAAEQGVDVLVGHSLSANILIEVAARGAFTGPIVLLDPCLRYRNEYRGVRLLRRMELIPPLAAWGYRSAAKNYRKTMAGLVPPGRLDLIVSDMEMTPPEQNRSVIGGYFDHLEKWGTLADRLADATGEIHFVRGDAESIGFDREDVEKVVAQDNIITHTITNSDHMTMLDSPREVAELVAQVTVAHVDAPDQPAG
ncbi:MAG: alpha/beta hydrolase [Solirubrobacterales bacterium]